MALRTSLAPPSNISQDMEIILEEVAGSSTSYSDYDTDADLDEIKIFKRALNQS